MSGYDVKSLDKADERREFDKGHVEVTSIGNHSIGRSHLGPGWKWSQSVKPIAGTDLCEVPHVGYCLSGRLAVQMSDGSELQITPGDAYVLLDPHDAWVLGDEAFQGIEFESLAGYATSG